MFAFRSWLRRLAQFLRGRASRRPHRPWHFRPVVPRLHELEDRTLLNAVAFSVVSPSSATAGAAFTETVTAVNASGSTATEPAKLRLGFCVRA